MLIVAGVSFWGSLGVTLYDTRRWPPVGGLDELQLVDLEVQLVELELLKGRVIANQ